ncbi:MAG: hypothetical protein C0622_07150 [Desulfuromonas sp.]|nr:MAG: hypothetical protein C0622_07150 [Desulfuromonas sp.]
MLMIKTDNATVEIEPGSHFYLQRGEGEGESIRLEWNELDDSAIENLNQLVMIIEGSLAATLSSTGQL